MKLTWNGPITYSTGGKFTYPKYSGVYIIAKTIDGIKKAKYVGQGNIYERMKVHESDDEPNSCLKKTMSNRDDIKVFYTEIKNETDRDNAEFTLYNFYGGSDNLCNENTPFGEYDYDISGPFLQEIEP